MAFLYRHGNEDWKNILQGWMEVKEGRKGIFPESDQTEILDFFLKLIKFYFFQAKFRIEFQDVILLTDVTEVSSSRVQSFLHFFTGKYFIRRMLGYFN